MKEFSGLLPESQGQNLGLTGLHVPCSLDGSVDPPHARGPRPPFMAPGSGIRVHGSGFRIQSSLQVANPNP